MTEQRRRKSGFAARDNRDYEQLLMLSYQHSYHAGGLADVHKHFCLSVVLAALAAHGEKPLHYVETHAGRGWYRLRSKEASKTGEAKLGIIPLLQQNKIAASHPYRQAIDALRNAQGEDAYPGSPAIAQHFLAQKPHRIELCELHPQEVAALRRNMKAPNIHIAQQDGYAALEKLNPPTSHRSLVFIDPSFEIKTEYAQAAQAMIALQKRLPQNMILLWYPILASGAHLEMIARLENAFPASHWKQEVTFASDKVKRATGSGLFALNLPPALFSELEKVQALFA